MMRSTARALSSVAEYEFGHPPLSRCFGRVRVGMPQSGAVAKVTKTKATNGATLVSYNDLTSPMVALGIYAEAGAKYDPSTAPGLSFAMRYALQTANMDESLFQIDRQMRARGAAYGNNELRKRFIGWKLTSRSDMWEKPLDVMLTCIAAPRFHEADIEKHRDTWDNEFEEKRWTLPRDYAVDQLEALAFFKEPLGNPRSMTPIGNERSNHCAMVEQWCSLMKPSSITVCGVNVEHDALVAAYSNCQFPHSADAPHFAASPTKLISHKEEMAQYSGGKQLYEEEDRAKAMATKPDMDKDTTIAIGFLTHGADESVKTYAAACVVRELLAIQFAESLRFNHQSCQYGVTSFYRPFSSAGLCGIVVREDPEKVANLLRSSYSQLPRTIEAAKLPAAISRAVTKLQSELETPADRADFIATSSFSEEEVMDALKGTTKKDVDAALKMMFQSEPCMYGHGYTLGLPSLRQLALK